MFVEKLSLDFMSAAIYSIVQFNDRLAKSMLILLLVLLVVVVVLWFYRLAGSRCSYFFVAEF